MRYDSHFHKPKTKGLATYFASLTEELTQKIILFKGLLILARCIQQRESYCQAWPAQPTVTHLIHDDFRGKQKPSTIPEISPPM